MKRIPVFLDQPHACSYLAGRDARLAYIDPGAPMDVPTYSELVALGFRRSGSLVYRPHCEGCTACVPVRIPVGRFEPNRSQRRVWDRNRDVSVTTLRAAYFEEHYQLYRRYLKARHIDGAMAEAGPEAFTSFLTSTWPDTTFVEFRLGETLLAVAVVDRLIGAWSAVYTFFDPSYAERSLGVLSVLWQIAEAREIGLDWLYLGYWIGDCRKMAYKSQYRPLAAYLEGRWRVFEKGENIQG